MSSPIRHCFPVCIRRCSLTELEASKIFTDLYVSHSKDKLNISSTSVTDAFKNTTLFFSLLSTSSNDDRYSCIPVSKSRRTTSILSLQNSPQVQSKPFTV